MRSRAIRDAEPIEAAYEVADPESPDPVEALMRREAIETAVSRFAELPTVRPELGSARQKLSVARGRRRRQASVQAGSPSRTVIPVLPLRPKATPVAYCGSSNTATRWSPNLRGGSGAPNLDRNASGSRPAA